MLEGQHNRSAISKEVQSGWFGAPKELKGFEKCECEIQPWCTAYCSYKLHIVWAYSVANSSHVTPLSSISRSGNSSPFGPLQKLHCTAVELAGQHKLPAALY